jgi:hypothetical protein
MYPGTKKMVRGRWGRGGGWGGVWKQMVDWHLHRVAHSGSLTANLRELAIILVSVAGNQIHVGQESLGTLVLEEVQVILHAANQ